ncbi:hypothetical protein [Lutimonas sp.]|uniref:hypothetical protein n=1 Tax=Lutimonas sp. TaxID=1872403 RepID=UPI003D9B9BE4
MQTTEIIEHARKLLDAHGDKAEVEAAQNARKFKEKGDLEQADHWQKIRAAIHQMRGPNES